MPVTISATPNPNAGGPKSFVPGREVDDPVAAALVEVPGVASVFMSADFVTVSKLPDAAWDPIVAAARDILDAHFG